ncbi:hypothetical protein [Gallaecimonas sp. GXIMD4217]|uniref:hypothetical protein n=1 Tax=Gallaecimonas sp. GXIMD4217 TaxID=3131927 RepID=UPI00311B062F
MEISNQPLPPLNAPQPEARPAPQPPQAELEPQQLDAAEAPLSRNQVEQRVAEYQDRTDNGRNPAADDALGTLIDSRA